jgi:hypothetical protein
LTRTRAALDDARMLIRLALVCSFVRTAPLLLLILFVAAESRAQPFTPTGRDTLRGLPGVEVIVEPIEPALERDGLAAATIRADLTARLQAAGIAVYRSQNENPSPAKTYVYAQVTAAPTGQGYAVAVQLQVRQSLRSLISTAVIVDAVTWDQHTVMTAPRRQDLAGVRDVLREQVNQFIEDWSAVHATPQRF